MLSFYLLTVKRNHQFLNFCEVTILFGVFVSSKGIWQTLEAQTHLD